MSRRKLPGGFGDAFDLELDEPPDERDFGLGAGRAIAIDESLDEMNDETFGGNALGGDWEAEHDFLVQSEELTNSPSAKPAAVGGMAAANNSSRHLFEAQANLSHTFSEVEGYLNKSNRAVLGFDDEQSFLRMEQTVSQIFDGDSSDEDNGGEIINLEDEEVRAINTHRQMRTVSLSESHSHAGFYDPAIINAGGAHVPTVKADVNSMQHLTAQLDALLAHKRAFPEVEPLPGSTDATPAGAAANATAFTSFSEFLKNVQSTPGASAPTNKPRHEPITLNELGIPISATGSSAQSANTSTTARSGAAVPSSDRQRGPGMGEAGTVHAAFSAPTQQMFYRPGAAVYEANIPRFGPANMPPQFPMPAAGGLPFNGPFGGPLPYGAMPPGWLGPQGPQFGGPLRGPMPQQLPNWTRYLEGQAMQQAAYAQANYRLPNGVGFGGPPVTILRRPDAMQRPPGGASFPDARGSHRNADPYAGLMTQRDRDWLVKVQLSQLNSFNNYADDYFYIQWSMRKMKANTNGARLILPISMHEVDAHGLRDNNSAALDGALGKVTKSSIHNPRRIIEVDTVPTPTAVGNSSDQLLPTVRETLAAARGEVSEKDELRRLRRLLLEIEQLLELVLEIEDTEYKLRGLPPDRQAEVSVEKYERVTMLVNHLAVLAKHGLLAVRKGRTLISRACPLLDARQVERLLTLLPDCARESVSLSPEIAKFVDTLLSELRTKCDDVAA